MTEDRPKTYVNREQHPHLWSFFQIVAATFAEDETAAPLSEYVVLNVQPIEAEEFDDEIAKWSLADVARFAGVGTMPVDEYDSFFNAVLETPLGRAVYEVLGPVGP